MPQVLFHFYFSGAGHTEQAELLGVSKLSSTRVLKLDVEAVRASGELGGVNGSKSLGDGRFLPVGGWEWDPLDGGVTIREIGGDGEMVLRLVLDFPPPKGLQVRR